MQKRYSYRSRNKTILSDNSTIEYSHEYEYLPIISSFSANVTKNMSKCSINMSRNNEISKTQAKTEALNIDNFSSLIPEKLPKIGGKNKTLSGKLENYDKIKNIFRINKERRQIISMNPNMSNRTQFIKLGKLNKKVDNFPLHSRNRHSEFNTRMYNSVDYGHMQQINEIIKEHSDTDETGSKVISGRNDLYCEEGKIKNYKEVKSLYLDIKSKNEINNRNIPLFDSIGVKQINRENVENILNLSASNVEAKEKQEPPGIDEKTRELMLHHGGRLNNPKYKNLSMNIVRRLTHSQIPSNRNCAGDSWKSNLGQKKRENINTIVDNIINSRVGLKYKTGLLDNIRYQKNIKCERRKLLNNGSLGSDIVPTTKSTISKSLFPNNPQIAFKERNKIILDQTTTGGENIQIIRELKPSCNARSNSVRLSGPLKRGNSMDFSVNIINQKKYSKNGTSKSPKLEKLTSMYSNLVGEDLAVTRYENIRNSLNQSAPIKSHNFMNQIYSDNLFTEIVDEKQTKQLKRLVSENYGLQDISHTEQIITPQPIKRYKQTNISVNELFRRNPDTYKIQKYINILPVILNKSQDKFVQEKFYEFWQQNGEIGSFDKFLKRTQQDLLQRVLRRKLIERKIEETERDYILKLAKGTNAPKKIKNVKLKERAKNSACLLIDQKLRQLEHDISLEHL